MEESPARIDPLLEPLPESEDAAAAESDPAWQIEKRIFLQRLWEELRLLPPNQEVFNNRPSANGVSCNTRHNAANVGTNTNPRPFDVRVASAEARTSDLPLYTFRNRATGATRSAPTSSPSSTSSED